MTNRRTIIVLSLALVLAIGGCGGTDSQEDLAVTSTTTAVIIDLAPERDCQAALYEAVDLVAQLVEFVDSARMTELQETRTAEVLERIGASIDELHNRFDDSCAQREYEEAFRRSVAGLEAETEAGRTVVDMLRGES